MENMKSYKAASFWVLFFVIFAAVPLVKTSDYQLMLANHILLWGMFAVAFNLLFGLTGMLLLAKDYTMVWEHTQSA